MNAGDLIEEFGTYLSIGCNASTVRLRMRHLAGLAESHPALLAVSSRQLEEHLGRRAKTLRPESVKSLRSSFRAFYAWAVHSGYIQNDPSTGLPKVTVPRPDPRLADDVAIGTGLDRAVTAQQRAMLLLGRLGCLRRAEIARLRMDDRNGDVLSVIGKGKKPRQVYCTPELVEALRAVEAEHPRGYYFPGGTEDGHISVDAVYDTIKRLTGWNPHSLRHAGATDMFRASKDLRSVQDMLGHSSLATTERYVHTNADTMRAAVAGIAIRK